MADAATRPMLEVRGLHVYYGQSHAIQGVDLTLPGGVLSVVGRNGMGKTTLCNTIMGLTRAHRGSIRLRGKEITGRPSHAIARAGVGYVPQGRRIWSSLSVDEHLRLVSSGDDDALWTIERIYQTFPRLAERRGNGGGQLSGGEQQMLAIARALLGNPQLLIMDEPTEGLAPRIVQQVEEMLRQLADEDELSVLVIEQNIGVAMEVSQNVAIMVNGRINRIMPADALAADRDLQQRLLGVGRHGDEDEIEPPAEAEPDRETAAAPPRVYEVRRRGAGGATEPADAQRQYWRATTTLPNRWNTGYLPPAAPARESQQQPRAPAPGRGARLSVSDQLGRTALIAGTFDTKERELLFLRDLLRERGLATRTIDLSTSGKPSRADVKPHEVAASGDAFSGDRGRAIAAMTRAFEHWIIRQRDIGGIISAGGSGGTALATAAMRVLPVGIPKIMISTVASGDVARYVGPADIMMLHSVADIQGINSISEQILRNGANALAGMITQAPDASAARAAMAIAKPAIALTMFGVTTTCVQALAGRLEDQYDCLVFHATGTGGRSMENLVDSGKLTAVIDVTTTELADMHVGGVFAADEDRFGAVIRTRIPWVGSVGALDMVNFGALDSVPAKFRGRNLHVHNPNVTLMRTTRDENVQIGRWLGERINRMEGPVRLLLPEGGVSALDAPSQPFYDPEADQALFESIERTVRPGVKRSVARVQANINEPAFVERLEAAFREVVTSPLQRRA